MKKINYNYKSFGTLEWLKWGFGAIIVALFAWRILKGFGKLFNLTQWDIYKQVFGESEQVVMDRVEDEIKGKRDSNGITFTKERLLSDVETIRSALGLTFFGLPYWVGEDFDTILNVLSHYTRSTFKSLVSVYSEKLNSDLVTVLARYLSKDQIGQLSHLW